MSLGRVVGGTVYPGLMATAAVFHKVLHALHFPIDIRNICVFMAPGFSMLTSLAVYLLTTELHSKMAGLFAAGFIAVAPGYISRSVAGSYDNEAIAIFLLMFCFYLWIKAVKLGSAMYAAFTALIYFYMVSAWGGYVFITNLIPVHVLTLLAMQRYSPYLYVAYTTWYVLGTMAALQIPFVSFLAVSSSEHFAAMGVFGLLQVCAWTSWMKAWVPKHAWFKLLGFLVSGLTLAGVGLLMYLHQKNVIAPWAGRFYSLWDTSYAKKYIPIISSVSEHQPTSWTSFFFDLHCLVFLFPVGVWACFRELKNEHVFLILYSIFASYFAGVMVRLMLTLTPIVCVAAGVAMATLFTGMHSQKDSSSSSWGVEGSTETGKPRASSSDLPLSSSSSSSTLSTSSKASVPPSTTSQTGPTKLKPTSMDTNVKLMIAGVFCMFLCMFAWHCTFITSMAYSSPSVVLATQDREGNQRIIDDFREAYYWLRKNTKDEAKIVSWWDYGYQLAGFANRTTYVDNNTWNNTHIATVGRIMASNEKEAYPLLRKLKADYVLVMYGGLLGYSGDDINKFLWMVRIAEGVFPDHVQERSYFTEAGDFRVDDAAPLTFRQSLMYKLSYYGFQDLFGPHQPATDRVRGSKITTSPIVLTTLEEAFTSEHWIVRIYKVKSPDVLHRSLYEAHLYAQGKKKRTPKANLVEY
ncbi:oligosaccharyl transferase stt3 subunit [Coelomomyces lativittatus]|nr:oligosaccharyl transferase stt3 subunit [Coelomomyces lativittatus]